MRRPWIKIETTTPDKPEICTIATKLRMDPDAVLGKLVRLWTWAELNRIDPNDLGVTIAFLDKLVGRKGFGDAMIHAGWLVESGGRVSLPNFQVHNGELAKSRVLTALRVKRHRDRGQLINDNTVTKELKPAVSTSDHNDVKNNNSSLVKSKIESNANVQELEQVPIETFDEKPVIHTIQGQSESNVVDNQNETTVALPKRRPKSESADANQPSLFDRL